MISFQDFLKHSASEFWQGSSKGAQHIVIGNEAADADSLISALTYAFISSCADGNDGNGRNNKIRIPVLSIPRADLATQRPETTLLLRLAGLDVVKDTSLLESHFLFVDDLVLPQQQLKDNDVRSTPISVTLVDHNQLADRFQLANVVEIMDHHKDLQSHLDTCPVGLQRNIAFDDKSGTALVASTCTLVAEQWFQQQQTTARQVSPTVSLLLLGTILLDSVNMSPVAGKGTARDKAAMDRLLEETDWTELLSTSAKSLATDTAALPDTKKLFQALQGAKFDVDFWKGLSVRDALRLDYKAFSEGRVGIATVLLSWDDFSQKADLIQNLLAYMQKHTLDIMGVMFTFSTGEGGDDFCRELLLCGPKRDNDSTSVFSTLVEHLVADRHGKAPLQLLEREIRDPETSSSSCPDVSFRLFSQGNVKASRKALAPILIEVYESLR